MKLLSYKFFLVLIYLISTVISFADETDIKNLLIHKQNKKLENVTFTDVNDKIIDLKDFKNKLVVLERIDGHAYIVNDNALQLAGIDENTLVRGGLVLLKNNKRLINIKY